MSPSYTVRAVGTRATPITSSATVMVKVRLTVSLTCLLLSASETVQVSVTTWALMVGVPVTARLA